MAPFGETWFVIKQRRLQVANLTLQKLPDRRTKADDTKIVPMISFKGAKQEIVLLEKEIKKTFSRFIN